MSSTRFDLTGTKAIVTGAGRGIGRGWALALAEHGADVALLSRTESELQEAAREIAALGRRAVAIAADVTHLTSVRTAVDRAAQELGSVDILVNSAGVNRPQPAEEVTEENWDFIMDVNLKGLFFCCQAVGRHMIAKGGGGKIINVSSQSGMVGLRKRAAYCASKGGVNLLTQTLAIEWARHAICVNAICPTFIETPMTAGFLNEPAFREYALSGIPLGRFGQVDDVVGSVVFLASGAADLITGAILPVDGGWTAQ
jgi:NAD(P)-dependent dehydrogenase (short-subunit alcohol dehydrogenase family)